METRLQRILGLRARVDVKEGQIHDYRVEIDNLHDHMRGLADDWVPDEDQTSEDLHKLIATADARARALQSEIRQLEADMDGIRDEIEKRMAELDASDLAYL